VGYGAEFNPKEITKTRIINDTSMFAFLCKNITIDVTKEIDQRLYVQIGLETLHQVQTSQFLCLPKLFQNRKSVKNSSIRQIPSGVQKEVEKYLKFDFVKLKEIANPS
jgi:hypothetical protein